MNIPDETFEQIKYYTQCGYDAYTQRSPYEDCEKLAELMNNYFLFILSEIEELEAQKDNE